MSAISSSNGATRATSKPGSTICPSAIGRPSSSRASSRMMPLIGVVMQVIEVMAQPDGRLQVVAAGLCRFEVAEATQTTPYSRADVRLLPDDDEVSAYTDQSSRVLARVAAGAASLEWASQEARLSPCSRAARRRRRGTSDRRCVRHSS